MAITVTLYKIHFLEEDLYDEHGEMFGDIPRDDTRKEIYTADTAEEAAAWIRLEGLTFAATGNEWAADPDGSYILNYATGERVEASAHLGDDTSDADRAEIMRLVG